MLVVYALLIILAAALIHGLYVRAVGQRRDAAQSPIQPEDEPAWSRWRRPGDPS